MKMLIESEKKIVAGGAACCCGLSESQVKILKKNRGTHVGVDDCFLDCVAYLRSNGHESGVFYHTTRLNLCKFDHNSMIRKIGPESATHIYQGNQVCKKLVSNLRL